MADIPIDGMTRVSWVSTIASQPAPTVSELNAGLLLQTLMTADGLGGFKPETADVDTSSLASTFNTVTIGRVSYSNTMLRFKKQDGTDTVWNTLLKATQGFVVLRRYIVQSQAWATSDKVQVFPVICGETSDIDPEPNTLGRFEVPVKIRLEPSLRALVA